ncbi:MAG: transglutaminase family protein [Kofleriaceae bacterium]
MRVRFQHRTCYRYSKPTGLGPHLVRLRPAAHARAKILSYALKVEPAGKLHWQQDPHGNHLARLTFPDAKVRALEVIVDATVEIHPVNPFDFFVDDRCQEVPFAYPDGLAAELAPFLVKPALGPRLERFLAELPRAGYVTDYLSAVVQRVRREISYILRNEPGVWSSEETLAQGRGSCRDSALLLVELFRARGLAARFVSGYLIQLTDEGNLPDEQKGVDRDVIDLHAWCEVFVPGAGWIGLDGTSGLFCNEGHIPLAAAVAPALAAAIDGTADERAEEFEFTMSVERLGHEFRPRVPYTEETWAEVRAAGAAADRALAAANLQLTMGGEPTFTSRLHARLPEWNGEALGATKLDVGRRLASRLLGKLGPGGVVMERQGKHYPGESLPRWALELVWRRDGAPVWRDASLLAGGADARALTRAEEPTRPEHQADATEASRPRAERAQPLATAHTQPLATAHTQPLATAHTQPLATAPAQPLATAPAQPQATALRAMTELIARLGLDAAPLPGFEDPWVFVAREAHLPEDVDPLAIELDAPEERRTLARALGRGLGAPVGYAVPLAWDELDRGWVSSTWTLRRGRLFLWPGDSPMGLRLPLDRLSGTPPLAWERDTSSLDVPREPLIERHPAVAPVAPLPAQAHLRTALCFEERDGVLCCFLPPLPTAEAYLALVAAVEDTARALGRAVRLEGYGPPSDPRLVRCQVTPDPGVVEVNLPPVATFAEYTALIEEVCASAVALGLTTEKYQLDGREVGSGGGHHLTLGGPTAAQSPWLVEPRLLASLLRFVQNHPSLSFLFTGLFVGPTSQAPRLDEARHDALGELELALAHLEAAPAAPPPWFVDRALRNLLVDVAGNTHRTEICIDKLYAPGSLAGRQGLVELRAFEMPPHERMAVAQMLLVRTLVAAFAREPYRRPLIRWGAQLHDRFMLPHFLWADFGSVAEELAARGLPLPRAAYSAFIDYRCPLLGTLTAEDVTLELRQALEPWPALGEETTAFGTARYVDSSLERLELRVDGVTEGRHVVLVNGLEVPLRATGRAAERIGGVRFRAWAPTHGLQPHIPVHHPLRFDLVDTWGRRSLGACTHHVWHPDGKAFDEPPLTAFEAAARRAQRFTTVGHLPWPVTPKPTTVDPERPYCLDLRRY